MKITACHRWLVAAAVTMVLFAVYLCINTEGTFRFREVRGFLRYDQLAEAILAGQMHLKIPPHPGRIRAADPTDPGLPYPYIVDAIIWNGKHYFTQDPAPAIVHALFMVLVGRPCPTGFMVILFATGSLIALWLILRIVQQSYATDKEWTLWLTWLCFALSGAQLYMVSRPVVYHEAIAAGMFFILLGTYCFLWRTLRNKHVVWLWVASLLWGLGAASRITLVFYPVVFVLCGAYLALKHRDPKAPLMSSAVALTVPVAVAVCLLLLYNYGRFGDFLDFGRTHIVVPGRHFHAYLTLMDNSFRMAHVPFNLYHYFLTLPEFSVQAPFLIHPHYDIAYTSDVIMSREAISSVLFVMPALLFAVPSRSVIRMLRAQPLTASVLVAFAVASAATFCLLLFYYRAVSRYLFEFTPLLFPFIMCNLAVWWKNTESSPSGRRALQVGIAVVFVLNVIAGVCLGLNGLAQ